MSWEFCSKDEVISLSGLPENEIEDGWSDYVQDMIKEYTGIDYGSSNTYTEDYDGTGTSVLRLKHRPVTSISSLSVDGTSMTSSEYKVYDTYVELVQNYGRPIQEAMGSTGSIFPVGQKNVSVTYVAGESAPRRVAFCAALMVTIIANVAKRGGADSIIPITRREREYGVPVRAPLYGLHGKLYEVMESMLSAKVKYR